MYISDEVVMSNCNEKELQAVRFIKVSIDGRQSRVLILIPDDFDWK